MKLRNLNLQKVLDKFEVALFNDRSFEVAEAYEFELFDKDESIVYGLGFDLPEGFYSIVEERHEYNESVNDYDWTETVYIEKYPIDFYNREFLVSRIVKLIEKVIL